MAKGKFDSLEDRMRRYASASAEVAFYAGDFEQAYRLSLPTRNRWLMSNTQIYDKSTQQFDFTAVHSLQEFASNMQSLLMPGGKKWFSYKPGIDFENPNLKLIIEKKLQKHSDHTLRILQSSNLDLEVNLALQDAGISTGLLQISIDPENKFSPIRFEAIPMHQVAIGEYNGKIENVWRKFHLPVRDIKSIWPMANISSEIQEMLDVNSNQRIELIESTIYYPDNPDHSKYLYSLAHLESKFELIFEPRGWSPWIPFRYNVSIGETWGSGPVRAGLSLIRQANMLAKFELTHAGYNVPKPLMVDGAAILNPRNLKMKPGMMLNVKDSRNPPLVPLDITGNLKFEQLSLQRLQQQIRDMLFSDPLGPVDSSRQTATESQIRQNNYLRRNNSSISRLYEELAVPIVKKTTFLLEKHGLLPNFKVGDDNIEFNVDGQTVDIVFDSPLSKIQKQEDLQAIDTFYQSLAGMFGTAGPTAIIGATNIAKLPEIMAEKLGIPLELVKSEGEVLQVIQQAIQQQQPPQQPQPQQIPQAGGQMNPMMQPQ
tara:strand:+ start:931 stop:2553 length:1623 start_codon:yes stop_codon:yes gene_type:complete